MATYGLKFYKNIQGFNAFDGRRYPVSLKIYEKNYNGATVEIDALAANSIRISYGNSGDRRYEPIKKTSIDFAIIDTDQFDYTQFYTSDATKFKVEIDALGFKNVGFIVQDSFSRSLSYKAAIHLTAIDNLSILDDIKFKDLKLPKYCSIDRIINACIEKCNPDSYVRYMGENMYYYGQKQVYPNPIKSLRFHRLIINTRSLLDKDLMEVLEMLLLSGMSYIYQSGTGYIVREYTSDYSATKLLQRKITAQFEGEGELSMTPAVRNFTLTNELNEFDAMGDHTPKDESYYMRDTESSIASYLLRGWEHTAGVVLGGQSPVDYKPIQVKTSGVPMKLPSSDIEGYNILVVPNRPFDANEQYSTIELGLMPSSFMVVFSMKTQYVYSSRWEREKKEQLGNLTIRFTITYDERGATYYYDDKSKSFTQQFHMCGVNVDNASGDISVGVGVSGVERPSDKTFKIGLYTAMSKDAVVDDRFSNSGYTTISEIQIRNSSGLDKLSDSIVKIKVGENNLDMEEEVAFSSSPYGDKGCMLDYDNLLISTIDYDTNIIQFIRPEESLQLPDMLIMEYQARACLFLTEAPAKKINGGVFLNTSDMVADYTTVNATDYLSSGKDQIVLADIDSSKQITRVDTLFDFIISSKYGDYRMNQAEINLLNFSIDGEFCEVREFYISDYIAGAPIINTFIQKNYLKHS